MAGLIGRWIGARVRTNWKGLVGVGAAVGAYGLWRKMFEIRRGASVPRMDGWQDRKKYWETRAMLVKTITDNPYSFEMQVMWIVKPSWAVMAHIERDLIRAGYEIVQLNAEKDLLTSMRFRRSPSWERHARQQASVELKALRVWPSETHPMHVPLNKHGFVKLTASENRSCMWFDHPKR